MKLSNIFRISLFMVIVLLFIGVRAAGDSMDDFSRDFVMPPAGYGSAPFWSWNEVLEKNELLHQLDQFAEQGMGGFFMHAREGLITEYMGPEWMKAVRISVDSQAARCRLWTTIFARRGLS